MIFFLVVALISSAALVGAPGALAEEAEDSPGTIVDIAVGADDFNVLVDAVVRAGLADALAGKGPFTVFAPTDAAFADLLSVLGAKSLDDIPLDVLTDVLLYHVVPGTFPAADVLATSSLPTLLGPTIKVDAKNVRVNDSNIVATDIFASNGVIHVIDAVLLPPTPEPEPEPEPQTIVDIAVAADDFNVLVDAVVKAGLVDALSGEGPLTVFAPTDAAFADLLAALGAKSLDDIPLDVLTDVLLYHVVPGEVLAADVLAAKNLPTLLGPTIKVDSKNVRVNDSNIVATDIIASNGVIHVIDAVLLPPTPEEPKPEPEPEPKPEPQTIVDIAVGNPDFSILVDAVVKAGLVDALSGEGPLTVFAPTDAAFVALLEALGAKSLDDIPLDVLTDVLLYHVAAGDLRAADVLAADTIPTLQGSDIVVDAKNVKVNDSNIVATDIVASNGVIHVIDAVLLPPAPEPEPEPKPEPQTIVDIAVGNPDFSILVDAVVKAGLVDALSGEGPLTVFAPTNDAFVALLEALGAKSLDDIPLDVLTDVLLYHVAAGDLRAADVLAADTIPTLQGSDIVVDAKNVKVNDSNIIATDIVASNGVIHVIDAVLLPPAPEEPEDPKPAPTPEPKPEPQTIVDIAVAADDFNVLVDAVVRAGLVDALSSEGPFTVFAPTDAAFADLLAALGAESLDDIPLDVLTDVLLYHVVAGALDAEKVLGNDKIPTLLGPWLNVDAKNVRINDSNIIATDIIASNGVIHVIDAVLLPPTPEEPKPEPEPEPKPEPQTIVDIAVGNPDFSILVDAVVKAGLVDALSGEGPLTVFAPTNDAFVALLEALGAKSLDDIPLDVLTDVLLYHVAAGDLRAADVLAADTIPTLQGSDIVVDAKNVKVNDSNIVATDIVASNGVIHVIDAVLLPPAPEEPAPEEPESLGTIVDIAAGNPDFSILVDLVVQAGLADALASDGPFTVFAPTNEAFENLPPRIVRMIEADPQVLVDILLYHVVAGEFLAEDVIGQRWIETLEGGEIRVRGRVLKLNRSNIIATDILADNGVIHVIDRVLIPKDFRGYKKNARTPREYRQFDRQMYVGASNVRWVTVA